MEVKINAWVDKWTEETTEGRMDKQSKWKNGSVEEWRAGLMLDVGVEKRTEETVED